MIRAPEQPTGWPMAIAPPLTLTLDMSKLQLTSHSDGLSSESLVGLDQVHVLDGQASLGHSLTGSGDGAGAHDLGVDAALAPAEMTLNRGFRPYFSTASLEARMMAAAPSLMPEALPAVTRLTPMLSAEGVMWVASKVMSTLSTVLSSETAKAPFREPSFSRVVSTGILVGVEDELLLLLLHGNRHDLVLEAAGLHSGNSLLLGVVARTRPAPRG